MSIPKDVLNRYLFDDKHVRGELVQLHNTYKDIVALHDYPQGPDLRTCPIAPAVPPLTKSAVRPEVEHRV